MTTEEIVALYRDGMPVRAIAEKAMVSHVTVWKRLRDCGAVLRDKRDTLLNRHGAGYKSKSSLLRLEALKVLRAHFTLEQIQTILRTDKEQLDKMVAACDRGEA